MGYDGASSTIRMYASRERRLIKAVIEEGFENTELIERKDIVKLLYKPIEDVKGLTEGQLERVISEYPVIGKIINCVSSFRELISAKDVGDLELWIKETTALNIDEINSFISGITNDMDAVKNAVLYKHSNGLAEGSVNKIKLIKRIMYGRSSFDMLRNKTLLLERNKPIN